MAGKNADAAERIVYYCCCGGEHCHYEAEYSAGHDAEDVQEKQTIFDAAMQGLVQRVKAMFPMRVVIEATLTTILYCLYRAGNDTADVMLTVMQSVRFTWFAWTTCVSTYKFLRATVRAVRRAAREAARIAAAIAHKVRRVHASICKALRFTRAIAAEACAYTIIPLAREIAKDIRAKRRAVAARNTAATAAAAGADATADADADATGANATSHADTVGIAIDATPSLCAKAPGGATKRLASPSAAATIRVAANPPKPRRASGAAARAAAAAAPPTAPAVAANAAAAAAAPMPEVAKPAAATPCPFADLTTCCTAETAKLVAAVLAAALSEAGAEAAPAEEPHVVYRGAAISGGCLYYGTAGAHGGLCVPVRSCGFRYRACY